MEPLAAKRAIFEFEYLLIVSFHMTVQTPFMMRCVVALVALVWLFPCVNFLMSSQISFLISCIIALIAVVDFFFNIVFLALMIAFVEKAITTSYPFNFPIIVGMFVAFMLPNFLAILGF